MKDHNKTSSSIKKLNGNFPNIKSQGMSQELYLLNSAMGIFRLYHYFRRETWNFRS